MANLTKKINKFKFTEMFKGYFKVIDRNKETYHVGCDSFETYLRDSNIIGPWWCETNQEGGEEALKDFFENTAETINKEVNNYMKNDYFKTTPEALRPVCNWEAVKSIWASAPMPR